MRSLKLPPGGESTRSRFFFFPILLKRMGGHGPNLGQGHGHGLSRLIDAAAIGPNEGPPVNAPAAPFNAPSSSGQALHHLGVGPQRVSAHRPSHDPRSSSQPPGHSVHLDARMPCLAQPSGCLHITPAMAHANPLSPQATECTWALECHAWHMCGSAMQSRSLPMAMVLIHASTTATFGCRQLWEGPASGTASSTAELACSERPAGRVQQRP